MRELKDKSNPAKSTTQGGDSDIVSFWLLLLFVAVFFGIAAEEARRPMFEKSSQAIKSLEIENEMRAKK